MRTSSFILALFLIVGHLLPISLASPLDSGAALDQNKRQFEGFWYYKYHVSASEPTFTASPVFHQESQTPTALSTPTPVNPQVDADPGQDSGSAPSPPPAPTPPSGSHLSSANAGVALASHGTVLVALTGLLGTVLAF